MSKTTPTTIKVKVQRTCGEVIDKSLSASGCRCSVCYSTDGSISGAYCIKFLCDHRLFMVAQLRR
ncbi:hypothetical protein KBT16_29735 [Nostoc sp. CCCryo 231-06]|nr:hypothetical protein [Nostoc sp. CCCryo 231-06]